MDLLLTHAYFLSEDDAERKVMKPYPPLGILYLSAYLQARGFDVGVFDTTFAARSAFEAFVRDRRPRIVGIYANLITRPSVLKQIAICRRYGAKVVVGGPEPANYPDEYLRRGADVVVIGEGELTMEELVPALLDEAASLGAINGIAYDKRGGIGGIGGGIDGIGGIGGVAYASENAVVRTPPRGFIDDLDVLPFPDREAIDIDRYVATWRKHHGRGSVSLITARGCPYTCTWCSHAVYGYSHRRRSPANVADEVELILERYRPDMLWYADDVFTIKPSWFFAYAGELDRRGVRIPFETISREDRLNEDIVRRLADMGCTRLWVGSESGSQQVLDRMKRRTDAERVVEMVHLLKKHGIEAGMFIMLGYEGEELTDLQTTVRRLKAASPDAFLTTVAYPIKGTAYYKEVEDRLVYSRAWEDGSDRDLSVAGRRSRAFYRHANRWMTNEVAFDRARREPGAPIGRLARTFVAARLGRAGMALTQHIRERA